MLHGREPSVAMDTLISTKMKETVSNHQYINDLMSALKTAHAAAIVATQRAKEEQQRQYNKGKLNIEYEVDDYVLVQNIKKPGDYKFKRPYFGPFRIREKLSELNYKLEDLEGNPIEKTMNITQLKRINFSDVDSWKKELEQIEKYKITKMNFLMKRLRTRVSQIKGERKIMKIKMIRARVRKAIVNA